KKKINLEKTPIGFLFSVVFSFSFSPNSSIKHDSNKLAPDSSEINGTRLAIVTSTIGTFYIGGMYYLSEVWYRDHQRVPFTFYNDNAGWKQMDKWAHGYVAYHQSRAGYHALRWSGVSKKKALWYGGTLGFFLQLPIEIFDGIYEGYGFSWGDVWANTAGSVLFMTQEHFFDEQPIKFKFSFAPSEYAPMRPRALGENVVENLFMDYNAQSYWLSINVNRIWRNEAIPDWLSIAFGYGAGGMLGEFENPRFIYGQPAPELTRYRQFFISPDIDFAALPIKSRWLKGFLEGLNLLKMPAPAVEYNTLYGWQFHLIFL
ncbi:MAG: DUF2279 domain-containing protein, partial [Cryomorphaceae bacterium]|nr:DUF2279 domain-containing protein [Cryomorphaceae bacterium]